MSQQVYYKIRHKKTGRYSKGGVYVNADGDNSYWSEKGGKTWDTLGKLRSHITTHMDRQYGATDMTNWEVIEYKCVPTDVKQIHEVISKEKLVKLLTK